MRLTGLAVSFVMVLCASPLSAQSAGGYSGPNANRLNIVTEQVDENKLITGIFDKGTIIPDQPTHPVSESTKDILIYMAAHEIGRAFIHQFAVPETGPIELLADDFATVLIFKLLPERAEEILKSRYEYLSATDPQTGPLSAYRAERMSCITYAFHSYEFGYNYYLWTKDQLGKTDEWRNDCEDIGARVQRAWWRLMDQELMPEGRRQRNAQLRTWDGDHIANLSGKDVSGWTAVFPDGTQMRGHSTLQTHFSRDLWALLYGFDWPSQVTLIYDDCEQNKSWSHDRETILFCEDFVATLEQLVGERGEAGGIINAYR